MASFVIAIDGPAGSGKSSVSKAVAKALGFGYLDTGAGYRSFALHKLANPDLPLEHLIANFDYEISLDPTSQFMSLAGADVTAEIRGEKAAAAVSQIAREPMVRQLQLEDARTRISSCDLPGIVVEGRDITTVVAPDADLRILLTASEDVRLKRRGLEQTESAENLKARDESDSKVVEFFSPADGVVLIDTSDLDFEASVMAVLEKVKAVQNG
ncbi:MAG: (d)CMP kinase [Actinomycetota bacterium]